MGKQFFWKQLPVLVCPSGLFLYLFLTKALPAIFGFFLVGVVFFVVRGRRAGDRFRAAGVFSLFLTLFYLTAGFFLPVGLYRGVAFFLLSAAACFILYLFVYRETGRFLLYVSFFTGGLGFFGLTLLGGEYAKIFPAYLMALGLGMVIKGLPALVVSKRAEEYNSPEQISK